MDKNETNGHNTSKALDDEEGSRISQESDKFDGSSGEKRGGHPGTVGKDARTPGDGGQTRTVVETSQTPVQNRTTTYNKAPRKKRERSYIGCNLFQSFKNPNN